MIHNKIALSVFVTAFYLCNLFIVWRNYDVTFLREGYPSTGDSIGGAKALYLIVWLFGFPILGFVLFAISRSNTVGLSLFGYNNDRPIRSLLVSLLAVLVVSWDLFYIVEEASRAELINLLYALVGIYLFLCLRVVFVFYGRTLPVKGL